MIRTREQLEEIEQVTLAPYAQRSADSAGRRYNERPHPYRTAYQRDRARIIHSRAFRRLEYKTQVFLSGTGDHLRTRLTHSIEVASISRTIARSLGLNEDLSEAIALAHDLGHSPFGHSGEETLQELMQEHGGFEHNMQSLRVVELLEAKYPRFPGINLSFEVREGLQKPERFFEPPGKHVSGPAPTLEAQVANLADEITYYSHDLDDGLDHRLLDIKQLEGLEIWQESYERARKHFPKLTPKELRGYVIRCIIDREVEDVIETSAEFIKASGIGSVEEVRKQKKPLIRYSQTLLRANKKLRKFLYQNLYYHPNVASVNRNACKMMSELFLAYVEKPEQLGGSALRRMQKEGLHRTVCDYISGMTDHYVIEQHRTVLSGRRHSRVSVAPIRLPSRVHE